MTAGNAMTDSGGETRLVRLKRLRMRAWHRGLREMDLVLGNHADAALERMGAAELDLFEALLDEADSDLLSWVVGQAPPPTRFDTLIARLRDGHVAALTRPGPRP